MSNDTFILKPEQTVELQSALRRAGYNPHLVKELTKGDVLKNVKAVLEGRAEFTSPAHIVDCDADPFIPDGLSVEEHRKGGHLDLTKTKLGLFLTKGQKRGRVEGNALRKLLKSESVLNANVLDYYLSNQHLIPEEWKGKYVFFWGTVYRNRHGSLYVRYLYWDGGRWLWFVHWLVNGWNELDPAAVSAS